MNLYLPMPRATVLAALPLLVAGCEADTEPQLWIGAPDCTVTQLNSVAMDAVGPQGFTGDALLASAQDRLGQFDVDWDTSDGVSPASDRFTVTFVGTPQASTWQTSCEAATATDPGGAYPPHLRVDVPVSVSNADGSLSVDLVLALVSPDVETYGAYAFGGGDLLPEDVTDDYQVHYAADNPWEDWGSAFGNFSFSLWPNPVLMHGGIATYDGPPPQQRVSGGRYFEDADASGATLIYRCESGQPCVQPVEAP